MRRYMLLLSLGLVGCNGGGAVCGPGTTRVGNTCVATAQEVDKKHPQDGDQRNPQPRDDATFGSFDAGGDTEEVSEVEHYEAYRNAGGALCGKDSSYSSVYCQPSDSCNSSETNSCESGGTAYDPYREAGGALCGKDASYSSVYCQPGDRCRHPGDAYGCAPAEADGGYDAYRQAEGPLCGKDTSYSSVYCRPADNCISSSSNDCAPSADNSYQAYRSAGGPLCGKDASYSSVYCQPGDSCADSLLNACR